MKKILLFLFSAFIALNSFGQWQATNIVNVPYLPIGNITSHKGDLYGILVDLTPSKLMKMDASSNSWTAVATSAPGPRVIQDAGNKMYISTLNNTVIGLVYYSYDGGQTMILDTAGLAPYLTGVTLTVNMQYHNGKILLGSNDAYYIKDTGDVRWRDISTGTTPVLFPPSDPLLWSGDTMYGFKNNSNHGIWISPDNGTTWIQRANDLPADLTSNRMTADRSSSRIYISGVWSNNTMTGIWYSDNGGSHWTQVQTSLITTNSTNQIQTVKAMYADGQTFYAAMDNNKNPSAPDIIGTTTGLANLAWDTAGLPVNGNDQTFGTMFLEHNGAFYLAVNVIDVYKKGIASGISAVDAPVAILYPNPATSRLYIKTDKSTAINTVEIATADGRIVLAGSYHSSGIDISVLAPGLYFVRMSEGSRSYIPLKFVKE